MLQTFCSRTRTTKKIALWVQQHFVLSRLVRKPATPPSPPPPAAALARDLGRQSHQYFRLLSPSDVLFIVKSGTPPQTPALHLTLRDSARCGVSSPEPKRLWRWPWLYTHIIPHATSRWGGACYKERVKAAAAAANSERRAGAAIRFFRDLFLGCRRC